MGAIAVASLVLFLLTIFACTPVESFWECDIRGKPRDVIVLAYANSAVAIAQDSFILGCSRTYEAQHELSSKDCRRDYVVNWHFVSV
jgi:hypothetical protein